jgi:nucleoside-diphosphate-sugar epimerase
VIPTIIVQALTRNRIKLGSLTPTRDFTYVTDTVEAFILAAQSEAALGQEFNLGTGQQLSIGNLTDAIFKITGKKRPITNESKRLRPERSEVMCLLADNRKAQKILGWKPTVDITKGLTRTIEWISQHLAEYQSTSFVI